MLYRVMRAPVQSMPTAVLNGLAAATMGSPLLQCTTSTGALLNLFRHSAAVSRLRKGCQPEFYDLGPAVSFVCSPMAPSLLG